MIKMALKTKSKKARKMCLFPKLLPNPKYKSTKKNRGAVPEIKDERVKMVPVG